MLCMGIINVLDIRVANMIAAGEVVERPSSCVKELLENAIDSGADDITVEIKRGGVSFIRVTDNGCGMSGDDLPVSIMRHATSKIHSAADLDGIVTLGFRGEALAAISSVSNMRIMSKKKDERFGHILSAEYGRVTDISEAALRNGTTVIVENLFSNMPARRKFLKKDSSEALAVAGVAEKTAISRPDISIKFITDGNVRFSTPGDGKLITAVHACLGREFSSGLLKVKNLTGGVEVIGYICRPEAVRSNRNMQYFYINGRYVKNRTATAALEQAFDSYCESSRFPSCVLFINIHPTLVDVNVHPTKLEVKFSNEKSVFDAVYCAVRNALSEFKEETGALLEPKRMTPADRSLYNAFVPAYDKFDDTPAAKVSKDRLFEYYDNSADPDAGRQAEAAHVQAGTGEEAREAPREPGKDSSGSEELAGTGEAVREAQRVPGKESSGSEELAKSEMPIQSADDFIASLSGRTISAQLQGSEASAGSEKSGEGKRREEYASSAVDAHPEKIYVKDSVQVGDGGHVNDGRQVKDSGQVGDGRQVKDSGQVKDSVQVGDGGQVRDGERYAERSGLPRPYRIIGVAFNAYIMIEYNDTTLIVDKHAAHERIIFEEMKANMKKGRDKGGSQMLLLPLEISFSAEETGALTEYREQIFSIGYDYEMVGNTAFVTSIPHHLSTEQAQDMLVTIAGAIAAGEGSVDVSREIFYEKALYQASCKAAMKAGRADSEQDVQWLVDRLFELTDIRYCPHGRPVAYEISKRDMEKFFNRG